jgi:DNA-binding PadR family transcriptional regulator
MTVSLRMSPQTMRVLESFLTTPKGWRYGYDLSRETGLKSGTLYPILIRLEAHQLVESSWETSQAGRPPRHMYRLTSLGIRSARDYVRTFALRRAWGTRLSGAEG